MRRLILLMLLLVGLPTMAQDDGIPLTEFEDEAFGIQGVIPEGWTTGGPGIYARSSSARDTTVLAVQAAPQPLGVVLQSLLPQLGLTEMPELASTYETNAYIWNLYEITVDVPGISVQVDLGLSEKDGTTVIILLQANPDEYERLHETVFIPVLDALAPLSIDGDTDEAVYTDLDGLVEVLIPTNWTVEQTENYGLLTDPDEKIFAYILTVEGGDVESAIQTGWETVGIEFDFDEATVQALPGTAGVESLTISTFTDNATEIIYQALAQLYEDRVYLLIFDADLTAAVQRNSQIQIIASGYTITALEQIDLTDVPPKAVDDEVIAELEAYILETMEQLEVPGVTIAIVQGDEVVYRNAFGVKSLDSDEPMTPETLMMIGSTTKTMTTMLMGTLVDDGVMSWDTPVVDILPQFAVVDPEVTAQITVQNLVCACTGVPRRDFELLMNWSELSAEDVIGQLAEFEFFTDFGEAFQYSNQMVGTGGYIAALAGGGEYGNLYDTYVGLMRERIFDPIGMDNTFVDFDAAIVQGNIALPHGVTTLGEYVSIPLSYEGFVIPIAPAGSVWSNVDDMAKYIIVELNEGTTPDGTSIVSAENLRYTWEPQVPINAETNYGLGWIVGEYKGLPLLNHGGNTLGFTSDLTFLPTADVGITVLSNQVGSSLNGLIGNRLLDLLFEQPFEVDAVLESVLELQQEAIEEVQEQLTTIDLEVLAPYLGTHANEALGTITLSVEEDNLIFDAGEFRSRVQAADIEGTIRYFLSDPPIAGIPIAFTEDDAGNPAIVFGLGVVEYTFIPSE